MVCSLEVMMITIMLPTLKLSGTEKKCYNDDICVLYFC